MSNLNDILARINEADFPETSDLELVLSLEKREDLETFFNFADNVRREFCGDGILLRGIIEFSSYCVRGCYYCGLNSKNIGLQRYRMNKNEILSSVEFLSGKDIKTVVLQSGDDPGVDVFWLRDVIVEIKSKFDMAITLSVGERTSEDYRIWKEAGVDRYLLKIETSDERLYSSMHPEMSFKNRLHCLDILKDIGYQTGSGSIIGLPGQTPVMIAKDIIFFKERDFDMVGIGPFIPHDDSPFSVYKKGDPLLTLKTIALTRIVTKNTHLPATTALGSLDKDYRIEGLKCGANVLMPNFTPQPYRKLYEIYPGKRCVNEPIGACNFCMESMAQSLGRFIDYGRGDSLKERLSNV